MSRFEGSFISHKCLSCLFVFSIMAVYSLTFADQESFLDNSSGAQKKVLIAKVLDNNSLLKEAGSEPKVSADAGNAMPLITGEPIIIIPGQHHRFSESVMTTATQIGLEYAIPNFMYVENFRAERNFTNDVLISFDLHVSDNAPAGIYSVTFTVLLMNAFPNQLIWNWDIATTQNIPAPVADFYGSPMTGDFPLTVQFTNTSTGYYSSSAWDFGDGRTSTAKNPSHIFSNPGLYTVKLVVSGTGGSNTKTRSNYINVTTPDVIVNFIAAPTSGTAPLDVQFTDKSQGYINNHFWDFGDGQTSTAMNPLHTYMEDGTYTILHTVTSSSGTYSKTLEDYITIDKPEAPTAFFVGDKIWGQVPFQVSFVNYSTGSINEYQWDFGDNTFSNEKRPIHQYEEPGEYSVSLTVSGTMGSNTFSREQYITVLPPTWDKQEVDFDCDLTSLYFLNDNVGWLVGGKDYPKTASVFKTTDGGKTWEDLGFKIHPNYSSTVFTTKLTSIYFFDENNGWVGSQEGLLNTKDGGQTWTPLTGYSYHQAPIYQLFFFNANEGLAYAKYHILKTIDGGETWDYIGITKESAVSLSTAFFIDMNIGFLGGYEEFVWQSGWERYYKPVILKTIDGGQSWSKHTFELHPELISLGTVENVDAIYLADLNSGWVVVENILFKTEDGGESWDKISSSISSDSYRHYIQKITFLNENDGCAVGGYGALYMTKDGGYNWIMHNINSDKYLNQVYYQNVNDIWVLGNTSTLYKKSDYQLPSILKADFVAIPTYGTKPLRVDFYDQSVGFKDYFDCKWDFGNGSHGWGFRSWETYSEEGTYDVTLTIEGPNGSDEEVKPSYITVTEEALRASFTTDVKNGTAPLTVTFSDSSAGNVTSWLWDFGDSTTSTLENPVHVYQTPGSYHVTLTVSWSGANDYIKKINCVIVKGITPVANFRSDKTRGEIPLTVQFSDSSRGTIQTWLWDFGDGSTSSERNPAHTFETVDSFTVSITIAGADGENSIEKENYIITSFPTYVDDVSRSLPIKYQLHQNYPNPFNPITFIHYEVPEPCHVELEIYNVSGQMLEILVSDSMQPGSYIVTWDATNYPSGVYFYKLYSQDFIDVKKMILMR